MAFMDKISRLSQMEIYIIRQIISISPFNACANKYVNELF